ncbi:DUF2690 domain-containing protein [Streptacidiphilus melanogenes]|uniref:DUF2690 domain-containing protein n=1 Tax=Streptacidiphilus melanogenes TaxID=411235 RepID=UPI0006943268|nr:DUF2690 domain-containing protein [Streptacidiphilus melanogenes]
MSVKLNRAVRGLVVAAVMGAGLIGATGSANAVGTTYTGQDPMATGCASDATTMESATVMSPIGGGAMGTIELRYSVSCHAAWARLTLNAPAGGTTCGTHCPAWGPNEYTAVIHRNTDGVEEKVTMSDGQTSVWTNMVDDGGVTSFAQSTIKITSNTSTATTASY